jgi:hypothetical protein
LRRPPAANGSSQYFIPICSNGFGGGAQELPVTPLAQFLLQGYDGSESFTPTPQQLNANLTAAAYWAQHPSAGQPQQQQPTSAAASNPNQLAFGARREPGAQQVANVAAAIAGFGRVGHGVVDGVAWSQPHMAVGSAVDGYQPQPRPQAPTQRDAYDYDESVAAVSAAVTLANAERSAGASGGAGADSSADPTRGGLSKRQRATPTL